MSRAEIERARSIELRQEVGEMMVCAGSSVEACATGERFDPTAFAIAHFGLVGAMVTAVLSVGADVRELTATVREVTKAGGRP